MEHAYTDDRPDFTLGVEEEFQLLCKDSFDLLPLAEDILSRAKSDSPIRPELYCSMLETATDVCNDIHALRDNIRLCRDEMRDHAKDLGAVLGAAGTHPFADPHAQAIMPGERYQQICDKYRGHARRNLIFGMHVHVGVPSCASGIRAHNHLRNHIPLLVALSANSPWWRGDHTGIESYRAVVFNGFLRSGIPPHFDSWQSWAKGLALAQAQGHVPDPSFLWYDVRVHPKYGTVETRAYDMQVDAEHAVQIAALTQLLVIEADDMFRVGESTRLLLEENRWRGARDGMRAIFACEDGSQVSAVQLLENVIMRNLHFARAFGTVEVLKALLQRMQQEPAQSNQSTAPTALEAASRIVIPN